MNHKETNPATFNPPNDRRHITIIVLLCVIVALGGAGVQAYRVHRIGWVPNATATTFSFHGSGQYSKYTREPRISLYRNDQGLLYVQNGRPNEDAFCFYVSVIERQYNHPFRKVKKKTRGEFSNYRIVIPCIQHLSDQTGLRSRWNPKPRCSLRRRSTPNTIHFTWRRNAFDRNSKTLPPRGP